MLPGFEEERLVRRPGGVEHAGGRKARVPAGEVVADVDGGAGADVDGKLQPQADLAGVGEVAKVVLRGVGKGSQGSLEVAGDGEQRGQAVLELDVGRDAKDPHPRRAALGLRSPLKAGDGSGAGGDDESLGDAG